MQILLASAKIMNDKVSVHSDITLSTPAFRKEAESFARDMAQYSTETIADMFQSVIPSIYPNIKE